MNTAHQRAHRGRGTILGVLLAGALAASACTPVAGSEVATPNATGWRTAPDGPSAGYSRDRFGRGWAPTGHGCTTRDAVLRRDMTNTTVTRGCHVFVGTLRDPYTGIVYTGATSAIDIDHLVPLGLAWRDGAASWPPQRREQFANDPANLRATLAKGKEGNRAKGDRGPEAWEPAIDRCAYNTAFARVAQSYGLTATLARVHTVETSC